jgi:hypothetical protein
MSIELTEDQGRALAATAETPPTVVDPATRTTYVLLRADEFDRVKSLLSDDDTDALYSTLAELEPDDWEDASNYGLGRTAS